MFASSARNSHGRFGVAERSADLVFSLSLPLYHSRSSHDFVAFNLASLAEVGSTMLDAEQAKPAADFGQVVRELDKVERINVQISTARVSALKFLTLEGANMPNLGLTFLDRPAEVLLKIWRPSWGVEFFEQVLQPVTTLDFVALAVTAYAVAKLCKPDRNPVLRQHALFLHSDCSKSAMNELHSMRGRTKGLRWNYIACDLREEA